MQNKDVIKSVSCAVPHKCAKKKDSSKKCAHCEISYSFVACGPRTLECGHLVCLECKSKVENNNLKCNICGATAKYTEVKGATADTLFQLLLNDLTKELRDKYKNALDLYDEREIIVEAKVNDLRQKIKNEIDLKVEVLKAEIDKVRDNLFKDVDQRCDNALAQSSEVKSNEKHYFKDQLVELENCVEKCHIEKNYFFESQKSLKNMIDKIQSSFDFDLQIKFKPSSSLNFRSLNLLGEIEDATDINSIAKLNITTSMPENDAKNSTSKPFTLNNPKLRLNLVKHANWVRALIVLPNGDLASGSEDKTIKIWNTLDGSLKQEITAESGIFSLILHRNGNIISGLGNGLIKMWTNDFKPLKSVQGHESYIWDLIALRNGDFATSSADKLIKIWSEDGALKNTLKGHNDQVARLVELPNRDIASCSDNTIKIWSYFGSLKRTLTGHSDFVWALGVLPNGDLISGSKDNCIKIWNASDGQAKSSFSIHSSPVSALKILPNGDLVIGYFDGKIKVTDVSGKLKYSLNEHSNFVWNMILLPNGDLASASADNTVKVWSLL